MGYISAQRLESERSKSFPVSISLQTKAKRKYVRVPGTVKYPPSSREIKPKVGQNHDARKAVSATLSVLK